MYFQVVVCNLDKEGKAVSRYRTTEVSYRYQAITIADTWDAMRNPLTGKREFGTAIIQCGKQYGE